MKKVKSMNVNIDSPLSIYSEHSIYKLTDEKMKKSGVNKRYLVDRTYSEFAMNDMDLIEVIQKAKKESTYVYGVAFANTVEEAELLYKNAVLICIINSIKSQLEDSIESLVKVTDNKIMFGVN